MEARVPFETYVSLPGVTFENELYTELAVTSFVPPWDWNMSPEEYTVMRSLDTDFHGPVGDNRVILPVVVPRELPEEVQRITDMFTMDTCEQLDSHPRVSTVPSQVRYEETMSVACYKILTPGLSNNSSAPLMSLFHTYKFTEGESTKLTIGPVDPDAWLHRQHRVVQAYLEAAQAYWERVELPILEDMTLSGKMCTSCTPPTYQTNYCRHYERQHSALKTLHFCPMMGCSTVVTDKRRLGQHLRRGAHRSDVLRASDETTKALAEARH